MRQARTGQAGVSVWVVVAVLAALVFGFLVLLGMGGVAWYLISHRPSPPPPVPVPSGQSPTAAPTGPAPQPSAPLPQPPGPIRYARYIDPDGEFAVDYPDTWRVFPNRQGVVFSPPTEDPREGTQAFFSKLVGQTGRGLIPAQQLLDEVVQGERRRYPDYQVVQRWVRPGPFRETEEAYLEAVWTNARGERMHGAGRFLLLHSATVQASMWRLIFYRSQETAWLSLLPVFQHMEQSFQPGSTGPGPGPSPSPTPTP